MFSMDSAVEEKLKSLKLMALFKPSLSALILFFAILTALLEGIGMTFIIPIIESMRSDASPSEQGGLAGAFRDAYEFLNVPYTLEYIIVGVVAVMVVRYTSTFMVGWLRGRLRTEYTRDLQVRAFDNALDARVSFFDVQGSDEILNAIVTQTHYSGRAAKKVVQIVEELSIALLYLAIAFVLAPVLTVVTGVVFGGTIFLVRNVLEGGYAVGDRVADANQRIQETAQAGTQGIRTVKLFGLREELYGNFLQSSQKFRDASIKLRRNNAFVYSSNQFLSAITVFVLIYVIIRFSTLSYSGIALFLFATFRLARRVSIVNQQIYQTEGVLPHVVRTNNFIDDLSENQESDEWSEAVPDRIRRIVFDDVSFSYDGDERILDHFDMTIEDGSFVAFVGQSGAGKSTVVSLLTRMYEPDDGRILANETPINRTDLAEWRSRIAVVRQNPYIFDDTLRYNLELANRDASEEEIRRVCRIAKVEEFAAELSNGLDTMVGDDGVQLSGGQRQRVALARALLKDADVLVLDEATSNLDSDLEREVQEEIERMDEDYTIVAIAHRLSTVKNADCIYVVDDGRIIESGPHRELVDKKGKYASLYQTQISH